MTINLAQYYDRFDASSNYERHLFRAGNVLQSAELNELQSASMFRLRQITDTLLKEGNVLSGADVLVDLATGATTITGGAIYLKGAVRGVPPGAITVPTEGLINIGVYLQESIVTEIDDPTLLDPALSFRNAYEPGAARLLVESAWGYENDGQAGDFYPVFQIEDGLLLNKSPPPQVDAVSQAIARYDRQSAGGYYISDGMMLSRLEDTPDGEQVYSMTAGVARVNGEEILREHARRVVFDTAPMVRTINNETHAAQGGGSERLTVDYPPIHVVHEVSVVRQETANITHGLPGALDAIYGAGNVLRTSIVSIESVTLELTTYTKNVDYRLTASKVDWSLAGLEPSPGETYTVVYTYRDTYTPETYDYTGLTVTGAVAGTEILITYDWALPRYDLVCLDSVGNIKVVTGVAAQLRPRVPPVPSGMLGVAVIEQRWDASTRVINNAARMVPMDELNALGRKIDTLFALTAENRLLVDLSQQDIAAKKGVFADPFLDDDLRDEGLTQTTAIGDGELTLGTDVTVYNHVLADTETLTASGQVSLVEQLLRTSSMKINPYDSFGALPALVTLSPPQDFWVETYNLFYSKRSKWFKGPFPWRGPIGGWINTETRIEELQEDTATTDSFEEGQLVVFRPRRGRWWRETGSRIIDAEYLRQIEVRFDISGYAPGEILQTVTFDGRDVAFEAIP